MDYKKYPLEKTRKEYPSICFQCVKAMKPAALKIAEQGFVGCHAHLEILTEQDDQQELAAKMVHNGIQCQEAATGWSSCVPIDSDRQAWGILNGILLIKGCVKCPYYEIKTA